MEIDKVSKFILHRIKNELTNDDKLIYELDKNKFNIILSRSNISLERFYSNTNFSEKERGSLLFNLLVCSSVPDLILKHINWKDFELIVSSAFDQSGYSTLHSYRIKTESKSTNEIDIIAFKFPFLFLIDCKYHKKSPPSYYSKAALLQKERLDSLIEVFPEIYSDLMTKLGLPIRNKVKLIALVVSWKNVSVKIFNGVPIVPLFKLPGFLREIDEFEDKIYKFSFSISYSTSAIS
ncbi:MAG: hypothetical protein K9W45_05335 [Candidatus Heimdallarchaeum aukensis]|uniref:NERD domain-containing protein n=1 Tax=Candidatus Heimdallarchaeum aukensis TaxID=2876573 RepID=A0A9Y1BN11_9ARCH|nr:MAG: hypothetical protein K9W45_05335 [Candidatus Heimdallarchaeum aukensis]